MAPTYCRSACTGHLTVRVAGVVAGDALHGLDRFMIVNAPIVRAGDGAQLRPTVFGFQRLIPTAVT